MGGVQGQSKKQANLKNLFGGDLAWPYGKEMFVGTSMGNLRWGNSIKGPSVSFVFETDIIGGVVNYRQSLYSVHKFAFYDLGFTRNLSFVCIFPVISLWLCNNGAKNDLMTSGKNNCFEDVMTSPYDVWAITVFRGKEQFVCRVLIYGWIQDIRLWVKHSWQTVTGDNITETYTRYRDI